MDDLVISHSISGTGSQTPPIFSFFMVRRGVNPDIKAIATLIILALIIIAASGLSLRAKEERNS